MKHLVIYVDSDGDAGVCVVEAGNGEMAVAKASTFAKMHGLNGMSREEVQFVAVVQPDDPGVNPWSVMTVYSSVGHELGAQHID